MTAESRLRAFLPAAADQGPLPGPESVSASYVLNDVGGLTFSYAPQAPRSVLLGQPLEVAVEVSPDSGLTWAEPPNSRFVYISDGRNPLDPTDRYSVECKSYVWRLSKAVVLPNGLLNADGKRAFLSANVGTILKTLLNEAQTRGALSGLVHSSFSTSTDSAGAAWSKTLTIYYEPGLNYLTLLLDLAEQGFCDFRTSGRALQVYNPDAALAVDRTTGSPQVTLRAGRDLTEAPFRRTWEGLANYAFFAGGEGATYEFTNAGADTPWGRQETFISNGSVTDAGTMASLTQAQLSQSDVARIEHTRGLDFSRATELPFTHYGVGDYVWSAVSGAAPEKLRVRQITLTNNDRNVLSGNVVLNDRFLEADVRSARRIAGITNGASSGTGTGGPSPAADSKAPAQVTGLDGSSTAYNGPGGFTQAAVSLTWGEVTTNSDGTVTSDIDRYEVFAREFGSPVGSEKHVATTTDTSWQGSPYPAGSSWWFRVRAVDQTGNRGAKSVEDSVVMAADSAGPQAPSTPTVVAKLGQLFITWDGLPVSGSWPQDFSHVAFYVSTVNGFTPSAATLYDARPNKGTVVVSGAYGVPLYTKLVAFDKSGNASVASAQASGSPTRLVGSDVNPEAITYEQLGFKDPGNVIMDGSFESDPYRVLVEGRSAAAWDFTTADAFHGGYSATVNAATNASTLRELTLMGNPGDLQEILVGDRLFCRMAYKGTTGATGVLQLVVTWYLNTGATSTSTLVGATKNGAWQQVAGQLTAPANTVRFRVHIELTTTGTTGTYHVDAVEVRRTVGTSIIQDAAITTALINNLAVNSAKIADLDVGKLTSGTGTFDLLLAGAIRTATAGARVEMTSAGLRLINGNGLTTVEISPGKEYLRLNSTGDVGPATSTHPFQIGPDNGNNMAFDNNEIMGRFNGAAKSLALNLDGADVHMAKTWKARYVNDLDARLLSDLANLAINFRGDVSEVRIMNAACTAYNALRASAYNVSSAAEVKQDRAGFDPFPMLERARGQRWRYLREHADDQVVHYGPMADDLPELSTGEGADMGLDLGGMTGVLWEAVRLLAGRVQALERRHAKS